MALTGNRTNATFYGVSKGKIFQSFKEPQPGAIERVNKVGKTVYEVFYDHITGYIKDIATEEHKEYGKFWVITIEDKGERAILKFNFSGGYANGFLKALPNVDLSKKVTLSPSEKTDNGKTKTTIFINQDGQSVKWFYTKETPNGLPDLEKKKVKGKEVWDDSEAMEFLENMVKNDIVPQLKGAAPAEQDEEAALEMSGDDDRMPF